VTKIADPHSLALHEALMIEGGWDQYSDKELASYLPSSSFTPARLRDQLASGELVLLKEIPAVPVFRLVSGRIVPTESTSAAIAENAVTAFEKRFGDRQAFPSRGTAYAHSDSLPPPPKLDYTPERPVIEPPPEPLPPPVVISENFGLPPLGPKVFAKSCTRPSGDTDSNEGEEKASNFGTLAMLAPATVTSPGANGLRPLGLISGSAMRLAKGWAMAARIGASVMSTAASTVLLALWPSKLGDSTLYTEEELLEMAEAAIRVRFHLHVDATGNLRVAGYHVNDSTGYKDRVPVAHAELKGENFEVVVDDDFTLVWYPDDSGHRPVVSTEYPADSGIDPYSILVTPIKEDGQEHSPPGYQRPFEDQVELIVSFPKDSGIEPLYLVFQKSIGGGEGVLNKNLTGPLSADEANAPHLAKGNLPPYAEGTRARDIVLEQERVFARVHGEGNQARSWMMRQQEIEGLTPLQIQDKFALPELPNFVSDVHVPPGTNIRVGTVGAQPDWGSGGAIQYELLQRLPSSAFQNMRPLP